jgi:hypothetical protein
MTNTQGDPQAAQLKLARMQELVRQDRRLTIHDIAEDVGIGYGTCQRVLTEELGMHRDEATFVPRILTADQKHPTVSGNILNGCHPPPTVLS